MITGYHSRLSLQIFEFYGELRSAARFRKSRSRRAARAIWEGCHEALHRRPHTALTSFFNCQRAYRWCRDKTEGTVVTGNGIEYAGAANICARSARSLSRWWQFRIDRDAYKAGHCTRWTLHHCAVQEHDYRVSREGRGVWVPRETREKRSLLNASHPRVIT